MQAEAVNHETHNKTHKRKKNKETYIELQNTKEKKRKDRATRTSLNTVMKSDTLYHVTNLTKHGDEIRYIVSRPRRQAVEVDQPMRI